MGVCTAVGVLVMDDFVTGVMDVSITQDVDDAVVKGVTCTVRVVACVDVHVSSHGSVVVGVSSGHGSDVMVIFLVI